MFALQTYTFKHFEEIQFSVQTNTFAIETNAFLCWIPEQTLQPKLWLTGSYQTL